MFARNRNTPRKGKHQRRNNPPNGPHQRLAPEPEPPPHLPLGSQQRHVVLRGKQQRWAQQRNEPDSNPARCDWGRIGDGSSVHRQKQKQGNQGVGSTPAAAICHAAPNPATVVAWFVAVGGINPPLGRNRRFRCADTLTCFNLRFSLYLRRPLPTCGILSSTLSTNRDHAISLHLPASR